MFFCDIQFSQGYKYNLCNIQGWDLWFWLITPDIKAKIVGSREVFLQLHVAIFGQENCTTPVILNLLSGKNQWQIFLLVSKK